MSRALESADWSRCCAELVSLRSHQGELGLLSAASGRLPNSLALRRTLPRTRNRRRNTAVRPNYGLPPRPEAAHLRSRPVAEARDCGFNANAIHPSDSVACGRQGRSLAPPTEPHAHTSNEIARRHHLRMQDDTLATVNLRVGLGGEEHPSQAPQGRRLARDRKGP